MEYAAVAVVFAVVASIVAVGYLVTATSNPGAAINQVVTPWTRNYRANPAITAGGYSAGQIVGVPQVINPAVGTSLACLLESICLKCKSNITPALTLYFLDTPPVGTYTDQASLSWNATDFQTIIATHTVATGDWISAGSQATASYGGIGKALVLTSKQLTVVAVATGSFTPTGTSDLTFDYNLMQEG